MRGIKTVSTCGAAGWEAGGVIHIITTEPNALIEPIHNRMPDEEQWLDASRTQFVKAKSLLKPYPEELMDAHDVSPIVNSARYDGPECVQPVSDEHTPRAGQLSLL